MKHSKSLLTMLSLVITIACFHLAAYGQEDKTKLATVAASGGSVRWDVFTSNTGGTLTVSAPDGRIFRKEFKAGGAPSLNINEKSGERLPDGQYNYELRLNPAFSSASKETLKAARGKDDDAETVRAGRKRAAVQELVESGAFTILNGTVIVAGAIEEGQSRPVGGTRSKTPAPVRRSTPAPGSFLARYRLHHPVFNARYARPDDVIPDDLIVQGSACVGLDCVNGEVFGFDTIRLKENNDRIQFDDTSTSAGFATNNWQIRANSSASGGASFLAFVDQGSTGNSETGTIVFEVDAGAPANSLKVSSTGRVGLRTATPVLDLHITTSDTPAHRLEQTNAGGFTAQTWDVAGNEANFFVRDVTGGSLLPFRIRPGAATSTIDISANSKVGIGTASPRTKLDIKQADDSFIGGLHLRRSTTNDTWSLVTGTDNSLYMGYATDASTADASADFTVFPLVLTSTNRVGIGTTAPTDLLSVNGTASKPGGGSWAVFSDERLKTIKGQFNSGLKAVMQLQPLRYQYRPSNALNLNAKPEHIGFGAQAVQQIIPEAVTRSENGYLQINNDPILWTMLNAIKEQQQQIEELRTEVRKLKAARRR